jgi:hypothetical protein
LLVPSGALAGVNLANPPQPSLTAHVVFHRK